MIRAYEAGEGTYDELAALFALSARTTQRWVLRFRAEGTVVPLPKGGGWQSPIQLPLLHTLVAEAPDATCAELCWAYNRRAPAAHKTTRNVARFCGCRAGRSRSAAGIILEHVIGATHGTPLARNRRWRRRVDVGHLIFVDEAGATLAMGRSHAWVAKGAEYVEPRPMKWEEPDVDRGDRSARLGHPRHAMGRRHRGFGCGLGARSARPAAPRR